MVKRMGKTCAAILIAALATSAWATACFDDKSLQALDTLQGQGALLYVWSPRMALSAQHAASAQRQAQRLGLRFVPLHDANVPQAELDAARQRLLGLGLDSANAVASSLPLCAASLIERDALAKLTGPGIALADLTAVWTGFLERKHDWDQTGNGVNHPNDFGHRVYAQVISTLVDPGKEPPLK